MSRAQAPDAPGVPVRRPPIRTGYFVNYPARGGKGRKAPGHESYGRLFGQVGRDTFAIKPTTREPGDEYVHFYDCIYPDGTRYTVGESPDGNACTCPQFYSIGRCPHVASLESLGVIKPAERWGVR